MPTGKKEIGEWFDRGKKQKATHMIIVCDTFDYEDYPVYVMKGEDVRDVISKYRMMKMSRVMEVYNLTMDKKGQIDTPWGVRTYNID